MSPLFAYLTIILAAGIKPGPGVLLFTSLSLSDGMKPALITMLGCMSSHVILVFLMLSGLNIAQLAPVMLKGIQAIAVAALFLYGIFSFFKNPEAETRRQITKTSLLRYFAQGTLWPFTNPFNYVMYAAAIPLVAAHPAYTSIPAMLGVAIATGATLYISILPYLLIAKRAVTFLRSDTVARNTHKLTGALCILIALSVLPSLL